MLSLKSALGLFVATALVTGLLVTERTAFAINRRQNAAACTHVPAVTPADFYGGFYGGALRNTGTSMIPYICPALDDTYLPKGSVTTLNVHVTDGTPLGQFVAKACSYYWAGNGGVCGAPDSTGNSFKGADTLTPALTYWGPAYYADFGYLWLEVPAFHEYSFFRGVFYSN